MKNKVKLKLEIGNILREGRLVARLTSYELAEQIGISPALLSSYENGKAFPSVPIFIDLVQKLKIAHCFFKEQMMLPLEDIQKNLDCLKDTISRIERITKN